MKTVAVVGTGPAGLMAASVLSNAGLSVTVFEKNKGPGRKLLIAGGSGLNISNSLPVSEFIAHYKGDGINWARVFKAFPVSDWLRFVKGLGLETFEGTSGRYFVREMKASGLLTRWIDDLTNHGSSFAYEHECNGVAARDGGVEVAFAGRGPRRFDAVLFALGGASWLSTPAMWPAIFTANSIELTAFSPANAGFTVSWKPEFLREAEQKPLKNIELKSSIGRKKGDLMITAYGIEGTPAYFCGRVETCFLDLKPDLAEAQILQKLAAVSENLSPLRRAAKNLRLDPVAQALLFHHAPEDSLASSEGLCAILKNFPLRLEAARPLAEAISSAGGVALHEIDEAFMLRKIPGVFAAGEMLDWTAPTGGFLIQACVSQGFVAAHGILKYLEKF